jgi:hypothetical protein
VLLFHHGNRALGHPLEAIRILVGVETITPDRAVVCRHVPDIQTMHSACAMMLGSRVEAAYMGFVYLLLSAKIVASIRRSPLAAMAIEP